MPGAGLRFGRVFGVEVRIDWSVLIIFALVVFNLGFGVLRVWHPSWTSPMIWGVAVSAALLFFLSVLLHEMSHALVARARGLHVNRITLFIFGGMAEIRDEPRRPRDEFFIAVVGPLTSFLIAFASLIAVGLLAGPQLAATMSDPSALARVFDDLDPLSTALLWLGQVNLILAIFNLVPGFPLDGGRVLRSALWAATGDLERATRWASNSGRAFAFILIGYGLLLVFRGVPAQGLWMMLIGWFLNNAALMSYRELTTRKALEGIRIKDVMTRDVVHVPPTFSVDSLVRDRLMATEQRAFPVIDEAGALRGIVCLEDVRRAPRERWADMTVADIMTPRDKLVTISADEDAQRALALFAERNVDQLPVVDDAGQLLGLVRRGILLRWIALGERAPTPERDVAAGAARRQRWRTRTA